MPYLSISHYPDLEGKAVPGELQSIYMDGNRLKGRGRFFETSTIMLITSGFKSLSNSFSNRPLTSLSIPNFSISIYIGVQIKACSYVLTINEERFQSHFNLN